ncbi:hypothetical protein P154DRAFT_335760 [Amniculicola lignicola CBS 123094]|uniref:Uncharacterized protein n=1 Tax=Amniculicola lignicola CBS 123094 TaxID=1392246 RepID=A0A6A5W496_9PLEO|nr:hypothetical protein P154DRAFT_335760 [Amniculicola lignicola CBS 123094]
MAASLSELSLPSHAPLRGAWSTSGEINAGRHTVRAGKCDGKQTVRQRDCAFSLGFSRRGSVLQAPRDVVSFGCIREATAAAAAHWLACALPSSPENVPGRCCSLVPCGTRRTHETWGSASSSWLAVLSIRCDRASSRLRPCLPIIYSDIVLPSRGSSCAAAASAPVHWIPLVDDQGSGE